MFVPTHLVDYLEYSKKHYPDKVAIIFGNQRLTYGEIEQQANCLAHALCKMNLQRGERVLLYLDNRIETVILFWAVLKANAVVSIINSGVPLNKLTFIIKNSGAKFLFVKDKFVYDEINKLQTSLNKIILVDSECFTQMQKSENNRPKRKTIDIDLATIVYTSGSTGTPKGVMLTHRNMLAASHSIHKYLNLNPADILISALPMSFDYGLYQMILAFQASATLILEKDFTWPLQFLKKIAEEKATLLPGVPTMFSILANHAPKVSYDLSTIRCVTNTGAALLFRHIDIIKNLFSRAEIFSMYGLTECKRCTYLPPEDITKKSDSVGIAIPNTEMWIVNDLDQKLNHHQTGQLVIRGATVMQGYWNNPVESAKALKDGLLPGEKVLYTGDYGYMDEEGYFYFCGRMDETIKSYGEKVSLKEIEKTIYLFPSTIEVAVIDIPDDMLGASIIVFMTVKNHEAELKGQVLQHCKNELARSHWPHDIVLMHELPKNINGKIDKILLKQQYLQNQ